MAAFDPSKMGSSPLASAFLQNTATQPTQQLPLITQPVRQPFDFGSMAPRPMPQPVPPAAPAAPKRDRNRYGRGGEGDAGGRGGY